MSKICDDLRVAILQYAMQGKLTKQLPEDGNAKDLLERIRLGRASQNRKIREISDDDVLFDIPKNWRWAHFGEIVDFNIGKTPPRAEASYWGDDIPWISIADMPENDILLDTKERITNKAFREKFGTKICPKGTLIMSFKLTVGRCSILGIDAVHNEAIISISPLINDDFAFRDYLARVLPFLSNYGETKDAIKGKTLNSGSLNNLIIPIPPLAEQKRIVEKIDELMVCVDDLEQSTNALTALKKAFSDEIKAALLQYAMQGKLTKQLPEDGNAKDLLEKVRAEKETLIAEGKAKKQKPLELITDDEIPFEIPGNWRWVRLGEVVTVLGGKRIPAGKKLTKENTGHAYIRVSDMKNNYVSTSDLQYVSEDIYTGISKYVINKENIYITVAGTIGRVGKIPPELDGANLTENADRLVFSSVDQDWLIKCLDSPIIQNQICDATTKVGQPKLAIKRIEALLVPFPPLAEQKRIVECLDELMQKVDIIETLITSK